MTLSPNLTPSMKASLLSSTSAAALTVHEVMDQISALNIPENPVRTLEQKAIINNHFLAANDNRAHEMSAEKIAA